MAGTIRTERKTALSASTTGVGSSAARQDEVAQAAYELFERRGRLPGHDIEDWLEAERIVRAHHRGRAGA